MPKKGAANYSRHYDRMTSSGDPVCDAWSISLNGVWQFGQAYQAFKSDMRTLYNGDMPAGIILTRINENEPWSIDNVRESTTKDFLKRLQSKGLIK